MKPLIDWIRRDGIFSFFCELGLGLFVVVSLVRCAFKD